MELLKAIIYLMEKIIMVKTEIVRVTREEALEIIRFQSRKGLFYTLEDGRYVGIDNSGKEVFVEDFENLWKCEKWLQHEEIESSLLSEQEEKSKRLIDYISERHGVNYANVMDYLKDLQYNPPEMNVKELVNTLLYIEANER